MVSDYLLKRQNLACVFVLIDGRHKPQEIDLNFIHWLGDNQVPFAVLLTKADKVSKQQIQANLMLLKQALNKDWETLPHFLITSSEKQLGKVEVLALIEEVIKMHRTPTMG